MADEIDQANERNDARLQQSLNNIDPAPQLPAIGQCHFCFEPLNDGSRFCDNECRDDYDYMQKRRQINQ